MLQQIISADKSSHTDEHRKMHFSSFGFTTCVEDLQRNYLNPLNVDLPVFIFTGFMRWEAFETTQKCNGLINHQTTPNNASVTKDKIVFQDPSTFIISHFSSTFTVIIQNAFSFSSFFDLNRCPNCFWCSSW